MNPKQLLCLAANGRPLPPELRAAAGDFELCHAARLDEAAAALRAGHFTVGVLLLEEQQHSFTGLERFLRQHCGLKWVAIFQPASLQVPSCRQLVHDHCFDFHTWPIDAARLRHTLGHAHGIAALNGTRVLADSADGLRLTGPSAAIGQLRQQVLKVAAADAPVLVWGESGTGKELVARAIHEHSARRGGPFVPINCGAMPASLIQSELFGYERGAFTGASKGKQGLIESAAGGSIFLDEIGDLPLDLQSNLLRFLQEKTIYRVGGTRSVEVDVRVIAASHVRLAQAVEAGRFREDLYYRLNVLALDVPALRERRDDVVPLAEHFFQTYAAERAAGVRGFSSQALQALRAHDWPGNVRELLNRVRRASVMAEGRLILPQDLGLALPDEGVPEALGGARERAERTTLVARLGAGASITAVARELGVSRMTLYRLMAKHGIESPSRQRRGVNGSVTPRL